MNLLKYLTAFKVSRIYIRCEKLFSDKNYDAVIKSSNEALSTIGRYKSIKLPSFLSAEIVVANIYFFRATSSIEIDGKEFFDPAFSDYEKAIEIIKDYPAGLDTLTKCCFQIIDLCLYNEKNVSNEYVDKSIEYAKLLIDKSDKVGDWENLALGKARLASLYGRYYIRNIKAVNESINLFVDAIEIFEGVGMLQESFLSKFHLSRTFLNPMLRSDPINIEKSIYYAQEALGMQDIVSATDYEAGSLAEYLGEALTHRQYGEREINWKSAKVSYAHSISYFDNVNQKFSVSVLIKLIKLIDQMGVIDNDTMKYLEERIERAFQFTKVVDDPDTWFELIRYKDKLSLNKNSGYLKPEGWYVSELNRLLKYVDKQDSPLLWMEIQYCLVSQIYKDNNPDSISECIKIHESIINTVDLTPWKLARFDVFVRIGSCHADLENWDIANTYFSKAMENIDHDIMHEFRGFGPGEYKLPSNNTLLRNLAYVALQTCNTENALKWFDYIYSHRSAFIFEDMYVIEKQINRASLFKKYIEMKQGQRVIFSGKEASSPDHLEKINSTRKAIDVLKRKDDFISRVVFYRNLGNYLKDISSWVFIPIIEGVQNSVSQF